MESLFFAEVRAVREELPLGNLGAKPGGDDSERKQVDTKEAECWRNIVCTTKHWMRHGQEGGTDPFFCADRLVSRPTIAYWVKSSVSVSFRVEGFECKVVFPLVAVCAVFRQNRPDICAWGRVETHGVAPSWRQEDAAVEVDNFIFVIDGCAVDVESFMDVYAFNTETLRSLQAPFTGGEPESRPDRLVQGGAQRSHVPSHQHVRPHQALESFRGLWTERRAPLWAKQPRRRG